MCVLFLEVLFKNYILPTRKLTLTIAKDVLIDILQYKNRCTCSDR